MASKNKQSRKAPCIAVLGTGSDVGKSIVTTAICRSLKNKGYQVAPFKAQNMSNNSGVTPMGLEMGRAQIVQAEASGIPPHVDMNPILLKPTSDVGSQVVLFGHAVKNSSAVEYHRNKEIYFRDACDALDRLREKYDIVVMEGAGSCAEVNLMPHDIVNFRMAAYAGAPVVLVGDIHRGGIFAQLSGTLACLPETLRDTIAGFIINRFRGDLTLFKDGVEWIESNTGKPVLGVLPWYDHFTIESEDSVIIESPETVSVRSLKNPSIAVIRIPHISNFTDFDPLDRVPDLDVYFLEKVQNLKGFQAVIIPGSKNTRFDLEWLHQSGWSDRIIRFSKSGHHVLGICGGYQMMGEKVHDPDGLEGEPGATRGLGLLPVETFLKAPKITTLTRFSWQGVQGRGYEIHMGFTRISGGTPLFEVQEQNGTACEGMDGVVMTESNTMGTYMHGMFDMPEITKKWFQLIGLGHLDVSEIRGPAARDRDYDLLAEHFEAHVHMHEIEKQLLEERA